jgi:cyclic dehypoxanthinyl futalosine synthase
MKTTEATASALRLDKILENVVDGARLSSEDAVLLFRSTDLIRLGRAAHAVKTRLHPEPVITYIIDRNINYTNVCISGCAFCAFFRRSEDPEAYLISFDTLHRKIEETIALGGSQILMQGGLHPDLPLEFYEEMLRFIKANFPIHIHAFSPPEILHFAKRNALSLDEVITRLYRAGLDSIPGGGAEILSTRCREQLSPRKCTKEEWLDVMRTAHGLGMRTTATMMFGHIETIEERVEHLEQIRSLQDETGGFTAFIPWTFQPSNTALPRRQVGAVEYLKTLAISRLYLDNIANLQASWVTQGAKIAQIALLFGANDFGSTMIEENVVRAAGVSFRMEKAEIERLIGELGFIPKIRNFYYRIVTA